MARKPKKDAILAAAETLFVAQGFARVSMDDIAAAVPVSKPTLYSNFRDKAALFSAVIDSRCAKMLELLQSEIDPEEPPSSALTRVGELYLTRILSPGSCDIFRVIMGECSAFPDIGRSFYKSGPRQMETLLAAYLAAQDKKKRLRVKDPALAAEMFLGLLKANIQLRGLLRVTQPPHAKDPKKIAREAVRVFIAGHQT
jgi:TetR/AcrR family transcriptional repressor of mexJK operon